MPDGFVPGFLWELEKKGEEVMEAKQIKKGLPGLLENSCRAIQDDSNRE